MRALRRAFARLFGPPAQAPVDPFLAYVQLLVQLTHKIEHGEGDSLAADAIRDDMDASWWNLSQAEIDRAATLSEALRVAFDAPKALVI